MNTPSPSVFGKVVLLLCITALSSCTLFRKPPPPPPPVEDPQKPKPLYVWDSKAAASAKGSLRVQIVLNEQKARIYRGKTEIGWTTVASGIPKYETPTGSYEIREKTADKKSNLYGKIFDKDGDCINKDAKIGRDLIPEGGKFEGAKMTYWMRFTYDGVGMHVGPIPRPGQRASHGCVRLPREAARLIFETVSMGTPVVIVKNAGDPAPPKRMFSPGYKPPAPAAPAVVDPNAPVVPNAPVNPLAPNGAAPASAPAAPADPQLKLPVDTVKPG
jgi:L,D-transpeptidase catalytic domain